MAVLTDELVAGLTIDGIQYADVQLTNAQILALKATPVEIVAAPGAGLAYQVLGLEMVSEFTAGAYVANGGGSSVHLESGAGIHNWVAISGWLTLTAAEHKAFSLLGSYSLDGSYPDLVPLDNLPLRLNNAGAGEYTGGHTDNSLRVHVWYMAVPTS